MDKFTDGFFDKSYDDLLNEYAGESITSKTNAKRESAEKEKVNAPKENRNIYSGTVKSPVPQKRAVIETPRAETPARPAPAVMPKSTERTHNTSVRNVSSNSKSRLDLREIKSFDEEMLSKENSVSQLKSRKSVSDTMEFKKEKASHNFSKSPVIDKVFANKLSANNKKSVGKDSNGKKSVNFQNRKTAILSALKINKKIFIGMAVCLAVSVVVSLLLISCINDVLAIGRDSEHSVEVVLPNNANTATAVDVLKDAGLIKNKLFCTVFIKAMKYRDDNYLPGVYYFTESMGVEKMIKRFKTSSTRGALISITIPEGYTIDKIFERLEKNNICTASALYKTINEVDFSAEYKFIPSADTKKDAYHVLEGYFFPATYEFEQGADPATVVRAFLNAFQSHWTEEYAKKADELGMSVDDIINLASIIEKEGANAKQFTQISSVLHNRLNKSGLYPLLECNSTKDYVTNTISARVTSKSELNNYILNYNTYEHEGLPAGAICNPGEAAIEAALNPEITNYYFFAHDNKKKIYMAETMEQHDINRKEIARVNANS